MQTLTHGGRRDTFDIYSILCLLDYLFKDIYYFNISCDIDLEVVCIISKILQASHTRILTPYFGTIYSQYCSLILYKQTYIPQSSGLSHASGVKLHYVDC